VVVSVGVAALGAGALVAAGTPARHTVFAAPLRHRTGPVSRPAVQVPARDVPPTVVATSAQISSQIDDATAHRIARDVIADLRIQSDALRGGNVPLVRTATDRAWLAEMRRRIRVAERRGSFVVDEYRVDRIRIATARRPFQGPPAILATLDGTVRHDRYAGNPVRRAGRGVPLETHKTFEVAWDGAHFLLVSDVLPPGFHA
jgi:hypothetical protein